MISRIDHIAVAARHFEQALRFFRDILGAVPGSHAEVPAQELAGGEFQPPSVDNVWSGHSAAEYEYGDIS